MSASLTLMLLAGAVATSTSASHRASSTATVRLHLADCIARHGLVEDLVGIELGFERMTYADAALEVHTACEAERLRIYIARDHSWEGRRPVVLDIAERRIALEDVRNASGPRLVALNIAELVQDLRAPLRAPSVQVQSTEVSVERERAIQVAVRVGAAPTLRYVPGPGRALPGAQLSIALDRIDSVWPWTTELEVGFEQADVGVDAGRVRTQVASAALLSGLWFTLHERLQLYTQVGLRGGWVRLAPSAEQVGATTQDGSGPWWGALGAVRLRYGASLGVALGLEGGWTIYGVYGDAAGTRVGLEGGWLGARLSLDWRFGG